MKVVLFCGGLGMRMRSGNESAPKPMVPIGDRPVLWHIMRYYAHFGHTEFILCLGFGAQAVKDYFLEYRETASNDFVLSKGGEQIELLSSDISDWRITFVDTGMETEIGERLRRVRRYLDDDEVFLASYGDVLTDAPMDKIVGRVLATDAAGCMLAVKPQASFHVVHLDEDAAVAPVHGFESAADLPLWVNGGFFVLRQTIFDYLHEGDDLVTQGCERAARDGKMFAVPYRGFWAPMDTLKERSYLEELHRTGECPWELWRQDYGVPRVLPKSLPMPLLAEEPSIGAS